MLQYYALALLEPRREFTFQYDLVAKKIHCYIPMVSRITKPKGKNKPIFSRAPLIPGYAFVLVKDYDREFSEISVARGFRRFLILNGEIARIRKQSVWDLKRRERDGEFGLDNDTAEKPVYSLGEFVRVKDGPFEGYLGTVAEFRKSGGHECVVLNVKTAKIKISLALLEKIRH